MEFVRAKESLGANQRNNTLRIGSESGKWCSQEKVDSRVINSRGVAEDKAIEVRIVSKRIQIVVVLGAESQVWL